MLTGLETFLEPVGGVLYLTLYPAGFDRSDGASLLIDLIDEGFGFLLDGVGEGLDGVGASQGVDGVGDAAFGGDHLLGPKG